MNAVTTVNLISCFHTFSESTGVTRCNGVNAGGRMSREVLFCIIVLMQQHRLELGKRLYFSFQVAAVPESAKFKV